MEVHFSIIHEKRLGVKAMDLCVTMDLVALVTMDGSVACYRTLSWERVFSKPLSDMNGSVPSMIRWNSLGTLLSVCFEDGKLGVIDIESANFLPAGDSSVKSNTSASASAAITDLTWMTVTEQSSTKLLPCLSDSLLHGGENLSNRYGMEEFPDSIGDSSSLSARTGHFISNRVSRNVEPMILLTMTTDFIVRGYLFSLFPLFSVSISAVACTRLSASICGLSNQYGGVIVLSDRHDSMPSLENNGASSSSASIFLDSSYLSSQRLSIFQNFSKLLLRMEHMLLKSLESVNGFARRWKDATKVILPKLQLLQDVIKGYELDYSPIEFMFIVAECGQWHPAAGSFSNHWNEQGINRFKSQIESTLLALIKHLTLTIIPTITNFSLDCSELQGSIHVIQHQHELKRPPSTDDNISQETTVMAKLVEELAFLQNCSKLLLRKTEETIVEARTVRSAMASYVQFIRENYADASGTQVESTRDFSKRRMFTTLFDPRKPRASTTGSDAQAEAVTATFLYKYLQATDATSINSSQLSDSSSSSGGQLSSAHVITTDKIREDILQNMKRIASIADISMFDCSQDLIARVETLRNSFADMSLPILLKRSQDSLRSVGLYLQMSISDSLLSSLKGEESVHDQYAAADMQLVMEGTVRRRHSIILRSDKVSGNGEDDEEEDFQRQQLLQQSSAEAVWNAYLLDFPHRTQIIENAVRQEEVLVVQTVLNYSDNEISSTERSDSQHQNSSGKGSITSTRTWRLVFDAFLESTEFRVQNLRLAEDKDGTCGLVVCGSLYSLPKGSSSSATNHSAAIAEPTTIMIHYTLDVKDAHCINVADKQQHQQLPLPLQKSLHQISYPQDFGDQPPLILSAAAANCRYRRLSALKEFATLHICGPRGVAIVGDSRNHFVVVDLVNDDDENDEDDDDDDDNDDDEIQDDNGDNDDDEDEGNGNDDGGDN